MRSIDDLFCTIRVPRNRYDSIGTQAILGWGRALPNIRPAMPVAHISFTHSGAFTMIKNIEAHRIVHLKNQSSCAIIVTVGEG
ncbi:hypothetical protein PIN31009_00795 [Pandoraea iniqua]|nr:hypothetical protein PIN31009_00795 [Pandoraea iniqua]